MVTRRRFLQASAGAAAFLATSRRAYPFAQSPTNLRKFVVALPGLGPQAQNEIGQYIPVATPNTTKYPGVDYYNIVMQQYTELMHPSLPKKTTLWGYADNTSDRSYGDNLVNKYLGPVIFARNGRPVRVTYGNSLPASHFLPIDNTLMGAEKGQAENRTVPHLHGALVQWTSDGGPRYWFTNNTDRPPQPFTHGPNWQLGDYLYPNLKEQSARLLWYHDHSLGITRLNVYAGLVSAYVLSDDAEAGLVRSGAIPDLQIPLVIQDKIFVPENILTVDKTWKWGDPGDLWYPHVYEPNQLSATVANPAGRWDLGEFVDPPSIGTRPLQTPSVVAEGFFDTILVNGAVYPYLNVLPRRYRFRVLNGSQSRFHNLQLYVADSSKMEADLTKAGPAFIQIGTEGGFLPAPVVLNKPPLVTPLAPDGTADFTQPFNLLLAPAERADIVIDFRGFEGKTLILYSDAPAPFPGGDSRNDYFTGDDDQTAIGGAPKTRPGFGPNTRTLMQIRVANGPSSSEPDFTTALNLLSDARRGLPAVFAETQPPLFVPTPHLPQFIGGMGKTLNEDFDEYGRLWQRVGTTSSRSLNNQGLDTYGLSYDDNATETANQGQTQVWNIFNTTGDVHPIHFHLVNVQILSRVPYTFDARKGFIPDRKATPRPPDPNEIGWKETVRMAPGEVTTVMMKFNAPDPRVYQPWLKSFTSPTTGGYEYMWHCHILEHEEHDMMRPVVVTP